MSTVLTVPSDVRNESALRLGVATLPTWFRYVDGGADVTGITGEPGWVAKAVSAIEGGARGVLVVDPVMADIEPLRNALHEHGAAVVLDRAWAASPSVATAAPEFARLATKGALVESWLTASTGATTASALLRQLALVRSAVGGLETLRLVRNDAHGYDALGTTSAGIDVSLSGVFSTALGESAGVRIIRRASTAVLEFGPIDIASPGRVMVLTDAGENHLLTPWETPHREAWRRLHRAVEETRATDDLDAFAADAERVTAVMKEGENAAD